MISLCLLTVPKIILIGKLLLGWKSRIAKCIVPYQPKKWHGICRVCRIGAGAPGCYGCFAVCDKVLEEFRALQPSSYKLRDEWPKIRDKIFRVAAETGGQDSDLQAIINGIDDRDEGL